MSEKNDSQPKTEGHDQPVPDAYATFMRQGWGDRELDLPPHPVSQWATQRRAKLAALRDPGNADIQNYIGYGYRRLRQMGPAMQHYQQALMLNRRHRSAHEHLGELYLALGEPAGAEQQLAVLEEICLIPCTETDDLQRAIATYRKLVAR